MPHCLIRYPTGKIINRDAEISVKPTCYRERHSRVMIKPFCLPYSVKSEYRRVFLNAESE